MFTCADNNIIFNHTVDQRDSVIDSLYNQIDFDNWFWFPKGSKANETCEPRGFYQWARENKYLCGPDKHPLEQAHRDAADLIQDRFHELVKKPIHQD